MNLLEMLRHTSKSKNGGIIMNGLDESIEHPTLKRKQFEDEVLWRLRDLEWKIRLGYFVAAINTILLVVAVLV